MNNNFDWDAEAIERLRSLYDQGVGLSEIGRRMGLSKNAVTGKAHRLGLPSRPSPVVRNAPGEKRKHRKAPVDTEALQKLPQARSTDPAPPSLPSRVTPCCWPIGEPKDKCFRFCEEAAVAGFVYCRDHVLVAYPGLRQRHGISVPEAAE